MFVFIPLPAIPGQTTTVRRVFSISPDGLHVSGTFQDGATPPHADWWTAMPTPTNQANVWAYQHGLVTGYGASGRGTNDLGDLVGFYVLPSGAHTPFFGKGGGAAAVDLSFDDADPDEESSAFAIDNARNVVGHFCLKAGNAKDPSYPAGVQVGFRVNALAPDAKSNPDLIKDKWSAGGPQDVTVRGLNSSGDLVGSIGMSGFVLLHPNTAAELFLDVGANPWFSAHKADSVIVAAINSSRWFVGWFTATDGDHGIVGRVDSAGTISDLQQVDYIGPGGVTAGTQLSGISEDFRIVGTHGKTEPFICFDGPSIQDLYARIRAASAYQIVSSSVASGSGGWVAPFGGVPHGVDPVLPWRMAAPRTGAEFLVDAYRLASEIADPAVRRRMMGALLEQLGHELRTFATKE